MTHGSIGLEKWFQCLVRLFRSTNQKRLGNIFFFDNNAIPLQAYHFEKIDPPVLRVLFGQILDNGLSIKFVNYLVTPILCTPSYNNVPPLQQRRQRIPNFPKFLIIPVSPKHKNLPGMLHPLNQLLPTTRPDHRSRRPLRQGHVVLVPFVQLGLIAIFTDDQVGEGGVFVRDTDAGFGRSVMGGELLADGGEAVDADGAETLAHDIYFAMYHLCGLDGRAIFYGAEIPSISQTSSI
mmetsp:Transcript_12185/g.25700  ORF Transcript_12185/g.25700 Transcript_12185/m.25700 type:complete len:236 (-) Transcript_12185:17-724(-)